MSPLVRSLGLVLNPRFAAHMSPPVPTLDQSILAVSTAIAEHGMTFAAGDAVRNSEVAFLATVVGKSAFNPNLGGAAKWAGLDFHASAYRQSERHNSTRDQVVDWIGRRVPLAKAETLGMSPTNRS